jgi:hypothetical protein
MSLTRLTTAALALGLSLSSTVAFADDKAACLAASDAGQTSRDAKKLEDARKSFLTCAAPTCPKVVQASCEQWLREVMQIQPTVIFGAVDGNGNDLVDVKVLLDGKEIQASLDGKAIAVDPGPHKVTFRHASLGSIDQSVVIAESQKGRVIKAQLGAKAPPPATAAQAPDSAPAPTADTSAPPAQTHGSSVLPYVVGGVGVAAIVVSGVFFLSYSSNRSTLASDCHTSTTCPASDQSTIDSANRNGTISLATGIVGLAAVGAGVVLLLTDSSGTSSASVGGAPGGGPFATLSHRF